MAVRGVERDEPLQRRMRTAFGLVVICYLGVVGRLVYLQGVQGDALRSKAVRSRRQQVPLYAHRGSIYDRNGRPMAASLYSGTLSFDPSQLRCDPPHDARAQARMQHRLDRSIGQVALCLRCPIDVLTAQVERAREIYSRRPTHYVPIRKGLNMEQAEALRTLGPSLIGFGVNAGTQRVYSGGSSAAQVIGFLDEHGTGLAGLERGCRAWLEGHDGYALAETDAQQREIPETLQKIQLPREGRSVHTTLDADAQHIAEEEAEKVCARYHPKGVSVVIVEPQTGDIRALVSLPAYDANPSADRPDRRAAIALEALPERCAESLYEPGSTLKAITVCAGLDSGKIGPYAEFYCSGHMKIGKRTLHCANHEVHHNVDPRKLLVASCNLAAAQIGLILGGPRLKAAQERFGLFDELDLPLPGPHQGHWSLDRNANPFSAAKTARAAFGHAIVTSPLHVALAYAALANEGILMRPRLLTGVTENEGHRVQQWLPQIARRATSKHTADLVADMLRSVVTEGTGRSAAVPGYLVAGKTGTAGKAGGGRYRADAYIGSFVGFLPAGRAAKPRLVILVAVDEPDVHKAYFGGDVAAPAFQAIATRLASLWHLPKDDPNETQYRAAQESLKRERKLKGLPPISL